MSSPRNIGTQDTLYPRESHSPTAWPTTPTKRPAVSKIDIPQIPQAYMPLFSEVPVSKVARDARKAEESAYNLNHREPFIHDFSSCLDGASPHSPNSPQTPRTPSPSNSSDIRGLSPTSSEQPVAKIARPPNAFLLFRSWWLKQREIPQHVEKRQQQLSRVAGQVWALLEEPDKQSWHRKAEEIKAKHMEAHPNYKFIPSPRGSRRNKDKAQAMGDKETTAEDKTKALREAYTKYHGPSPIPSRKKQSKKARRGSSSSSVNPAHFSLPNSPQSRSIPIHPSSIPFSGPSRIQNPLFLQQSDFTQIPIAPRPSTSLGFYGNPQQYSFADANAAASNTIDGFNYSFGNNDQNMMYGNLETVVTPADLAKQMDGLVLFAGSSPHIEAKTQDYLHQQLGGAFTHSAIASPQNNGDDAQSYDLLAASEANFGLGNDFDITPYVNPSQDFYASSTMGLDLQSFLPNQYDYTFGN